MRIGLERRDTIWGLHNWCQVHYIPTVLSNGHNVLRDMIRYSDLVPVSLAVLFDIETYGFV
jgi:hypothetical protein